jgi:hypothetical protein
VKNAVPCQETEGSNPASSTSESDANLLTRVWSSLVRVRCGDKSGVASFSGGSVAAELFCSPAPATPRGEGEAKHAGAGSGTALTTLGFFYRLRQLEGRGGGLPLSVDQSSALYDF